MITEYFADLPDLHYPNFNALIRDVCERYPDNIALRMQTDAGFVELTYRHLGVGVEAWGRLLEEHGLSKGRHVGLLSENRIEWAVAYLAAVTRGLVIVPFDILAGGEALATYGRFADLDGIFFSAQFEERAALITASASSCKLLLHFDELSQELEPSLPERITGLKTVDLRDAQLFGGGANGSRNPSAAGSSSVTVPSADPGPAPAAAQPADPGATAASEAALTPVDIAPDHPASIIFTSGTTGSPKGVTLSHHGIIANINASIQSLPIDEHDNFIAVLPLHHTYPTTCSFLSPVSVGASITIVSRIVGPKIIQATRETDGTILIGVPLLFDKLRRGIQSRLSEQPPAKRVLIAGMRALARLSRSESANPGTVLFRGLRERAGLGTLRLLVSGGGPLSPDSAAFFSELGFTIVQGYGMSENGPLITTNTERHQDNHSAGLPVKNTEIRIAHPDRQGVGEIQVTSPSLMLGYYKNPEATEEVFTEDGYLRTGDLGQFDHRGFLFIRGRSRNLIVSPAGKNIFPEEIEVKFPEGGVVAEVLVMGQRVSSENAGERVIAICVPDFDRIREQYDGTLPSSQEIRSLVQDQVDAVNSELEAYKRIERLYVREEEFEKTASGKVRRFLYREYAQPGYEPDANTPAR